MTEAALAEAERRHRTLFEALGVAVYTTDAQGRLTSYNDAATALWGWCPPLGDTRWCGSWRLFWPDGRPLPHDTCPMAMALRENRPIRGLEAVAERPDGSRVPFLPFPTPLRDAEGTLTGAVNVLVDITGRQAAEAALATSEALFRAVFETTPDCIKLVAPDGTLLRINDAGLRMLEAGAPAEAEGKCVFDLIAPEHRAAWTANHERVCRGEALDWEFDVISLRGTRRRMETRAAPLRMPDGRFAQLAITRDVTERKAAEERQALLAQEVDHRAKNVLAVALSLVRMTRAEDPRHFAEAVEGRIAALAHAHTLLAGEGWSGAALRVVAERELAPHLAAGRVGLHGPPVWLAPGAVQPISLLLHELATNAAKYGSLSAPTMGGRVDLSWILEGQGPASTSLRMIWTESGGPPLEANPPPRRGFGSKLIETTARTQLGGAVRLHWERTGLRCEVTIAADRLLPREAGGGAEASAAGDAVPLRALRPDRPPEGRDATRIAPVSLLGRRILVAEDEPLVALELEATLRGLGCEVLGPAATLEEALRLATAPSERIDAAVLDINLAGRASFPAADALAKRGVPIVFATGYGDLPDGRTVGSGRGVLLRKPLGRGEVEAALAQVLEPQEEPDAAEAAALDRATPRGEPGLGA